MKIQIQMVYYIKIYRRHRCTRSSRASQKNYQLVTMIIIINITFSGWHKSHINFCFIRSSFIHVSKMPAVNEHQNAVCSSSALLALFVRWIMAPKKSDWIFFILKFVFIFILIRTNWPISQVMQMRKNVSFRGVRPLTPNQGLCPSTPLGALPQTPL